jgi:hypothetical protein
MQSFDIHPFVGALPIRFGLQRTAVIELLGQPEASHAVWDKSGTIDYWEASSINVGYNQETVVNHVGFRPAKVILTVQGSPLWNGNDIVDPNPELLRRDPNPVEFLGILVFLLLGVTTTGFHDDDENQLALTVFPHGARDEFLKDSHRPDLSKYSSQRL